MAYDLNVAKIAYSTAVKLNASNKVILALFEAGIVESGMRNLPYGDRDKDGNMTSSRGFLQQKTEYWGGLDCVMNVACATTSFVNAAKKIENEHRTAGQLAQGVQKSALPDRYDEEEKEAKKLLKKIGSKTIEAILPVKGATLKNISSKFGEQRSDHVHKGLDIAMPIGTTVFTIFGGVVTNTGYDGGYGNFVTVLNPNGYQEHFAHLSKVSVNKNDNLSEGQKIGEVGSTGNSTGPHLHYEIRTPSGEPIDPLDYLQQEGSYVEKDSTSIAEIIKTLISDLIANQVTIWVYLGIIIIVFISLIFIFNKQKAVVSTGKKTVGGLVDVGASFIPGGSLVTKTGKKAIKKVGGK